jgi:hypothetical protein
MNTKGQFTAGPNIAMKVPLWARKEIRKRLKAK